MLKKIPVFVMLCCSYVNCAGYSFTATRARSDSIIIASDIQPFLTLGISSFSALVPSSIKNLNDGNLHIFAFDVGQANFIVMRRNKEVVIIDAGAGSKASETSVLGPKISDVFNGATLKGVFITHPHSDHFNLFKDDSTFYLGKVLGTAAFDAEFYLGGNEADWTKPHETEKIPETRNFVDKIKPDKRHYYENGGIYSLIDEVLFRVFYLPVPSSGGNKLSLLLQVSYKDNLRPLHKVRNFAKIDG